MEKHELSSIRKKVFLLDLLVLISKTDGDIDDREKDIILALAQSIGGNEVDFTINTTIEDLKHMMPDFALNEKFIIIRELFKLAAADLKILEKEKKFIKDISILFELTNEDYLEVEKWAVARMMAESDLNWYINRAVSDRVKNKGVNE